MDEFKQYEIIYTDSATQDILEKAEYILYHLHDPINAEAWYQNLRSEILKDLSSAPYKYPPYPVESWNSKGYREMVTKTDVILYTVDDAAAAVTIHMVSTIRRDIPTHLST